MTSEATGARRSFAAWAVAAGYVLFTSTAFIGIKVGVRYAPPLTLLAVRFLIAGGLLAGLVRFLGIPWPANRGAWTRLSVLGLLNMGLPAVFNFVGLRYASAGMAAIMLVIHPVLLALLGPRLLGEPLTRTKVIGLVLGSGGVLYIMAARIGASGRTDSPLGIALFFFAVVSLVLATLLFKRYPPREPLLVVNTVQQLVSGAVVLPAIAALENPTHVTLGAPLALALAQLVFLVSIGSGLLWFWLLGRGQAGTASSLMFFAPALGVVAAHFVLHEKLLARDGIGLAAVSVGVILIRRPPKLPPAVRT